jgi:hypothetical protein
MSRQLPTLRVVSFALTSLLLAAFPAGAQQNESTPEISSPADPQQNESTSEAAADDAQQDRLMSEAGVPEFYQRRLHLSPTQNQGPLSAA